MKSDRDGINLAAKPSGTGCAECSAAGGWWFHLRRCVECGHIGCCDTSPNQHATKQTRRRVTRSSRASSRANDGFTTIARERLSPARSFKAPTRIRWISRCRDRTGRCLRTGKRCSMNRGVKALRGRASALQLDPRRSSRRCCYPPPSGGRHYLSSVAAVQARGLAIALLLR